MKIFIIFSDNDLQKAILQASKSDLFLGDLNQKSHLELNIIQPELSNDDEFEILDAVNKIFQELVNDKLKHILGFSNKFYQASVLPIAAYINTLQRTINNNSELNEVVFPSKLIFSQEKSTYDLAEHEVQRKFLYQRNHVFQPYLEKVCHQKGIKTSYLSRYELSLLFYKTSLRYYLIFFLRLTFTLLRGTKCKKAKKQKIKDEIDFIAVTRLARKSEYIEPLFSKFDLNGKLICAENFLNTNSNYLFCSNYFFNPKDQIIKVNNISFISVLFEYSKLFRVQLFRNKAINLSINTIDINLNNAFKELLSSYPDLILYIKSIENTLLTIGTPRLKLLITTELKSPYAYADAYIAKKNGYKCIQIMDCDQSDEPLPMPVSGDILLTNTKSLYIKLTQSWRNTKAQVSYWGNLTYLSLNNRQIKTDNTKIKWCYFTTSRVQEDSYILKKLNEIHKMYPIEFIIKLHPRDTNKNYHQYKDFRVIEDAKISKNELFQLFDFALTLSSAIINDLFIYNKPFLLISPITYSNFNVNVHIEVYRNIEIEIDKFEYFIHNPKVWLESYKVYAKQYKIDNEYLNGVDVFKQRLLNF